MENKTLNKALEQFNKKNYQEAKEVLLSISNKNSIAQYYLGAIYRMGLGVRDDQKEAFNWFLKAAKRGHKESQYLVASAYASKHFIYNETELVKNQYEIIERKANEDFSIWQDNLSYLDLQGIGVIPCDDEAYRWMLKVAMQGYVKAFLSIGDFYDWGIGVKRDRIEASYWYKKAADNGNIEAIIRMANYHNSDDNFLKAIDEYVKAYKLGDNYSAFIIGKRYEKTESNNRDYKKAFKWYLISATEFNYSEAHLKLGNFYYEGKGVKKNIEKAIDHYKKAIKVYASTHSFGYLGEAYDKLEELYNKGYSNLISIENIIEYLKHSADYGYDSARIRLREYFNDGYDLGEKYQVMFELLIQAEQGDKKAQLEYGNTYLIESILYKSTKLMVRNWYLEDATKGVVNAQYLLSLTYTGGESSIERRYWLKKAAGNGHSLAQYKMAYIYKDDDIETSLKYLTLASEANVDAQIELGYNHAHGIVVNKNYLEAYRLYQLAASNMRMIKDIYLLRALNCVKLQHNAANDKAESFALQGDVNAQLYMGCLYQYGFEVKRNLNKSLFWYEMAKKHGSDEAQIQIETIGKDIE